MKPLNCTLLPKFGWRSGCLRKMAGLQYTKAPHPPLNEHEETHDTSVCDYRGTCAQTTNNKML